MTLRRSIYRADVRLADGAPQTFRLWSPAGRRLRPGPAERNRRYTTLHYGIIGCVNEVGTVPGRGREVVPALEADRLLSELAGKELHLPDRAVMSRGPTNCPACGAPNIMWGCDPDQTRGRDEIHPLVWHETEWMADTFICRDCNAGWIEPDDPEPITWVRPYWIEAI